MKLETMAAFIEKVKTETGRNYNADNFKYTSTDSLVYIYESTHYYNGTAERGAVIIYAASNKTLKRVLHTEFNRSDFIHEPENENARGLYCYNLRDVLAGTDGWNFPGYITYGEKVRDGLFSAGFIIFDEPEEYSNNRRFWLQKVEERQNSFKRQLNNFKPVPDSVKLFIELQAF